MRAEWSCDVVNTLQGLSDATALEISAFEFLVKRGEAFLHELHFEGERIGFVVSRFVEEVDGLAFVVCAAVARPVRGVCVASYIDEKYSQVAREAGAVRTRFFTRRAGLVRKMAARGYSKSWKMEKEM